MIKVLNRTILTTCHFEDYLALPGWSYSGIKQDGKEWQAPTLKMQLGTDVDHYLTDPINYDHNNRELVVPIATELRKHIQPLVKFLKPQLAVTCEFEHGGFRMMYKGRGDLVIVDKLVIDIKVSEMPLMKAIDYFGYDHQLRGYAKAFGCKSAIIISISPKNPKHVQMYNVPLHQDKYIWWEHEILKRGEPIL